MGTIANIVKVLTNDELASQAVINFRKAQCNTCSFKNGKWCGTPIKGNYVNHNGKVIKLCGCILSEKQTLKKQYCPAKRW
jgi:hypothetical protein